MTRRILIILLCVVIGSSLGWWRVGLAMDARQGLADSLRGGATEGIVLSSRRGPKAVTFSVNVAGGYVHAVAIHAPFLQPGDAVTMKCGRYTGVEPGRKNPTCRWATLERVGAGHGPAAFFARLRAAGVSRLEDAFGRPEGDWLAGLLVGDDSGMDSRWGDIFRRTGTSHLTAVSGENLAYVLIVAGQLGEALFFDRRARLSVKVLSVTAFAFLTGLPTSILRAALMFYARELAMRVFGRPVSRMRALLVAMLVIVLLDPLALAFDRGFQLSALAVFGIAAFAEPLNATVFRRLPKIPRGWAAQTAAATLTTAPLIAWMSGAYPLVALPANLIVTPAVGPLTALAAIAVVVSWSWSAAGRALGFATTPLVSVPLWMIERLAALPFASVTGLVATIALAITTTLALSAALLWRKREGERRFLPPT